MARSKVASVLRAQNEDAMASMSPEERLSLALELGRRGIQMYMNAHDVDELTAARELRRLGRTGRRYSHCMDDETP